ncbi:hypothetical protein D9V32_13960 [Mycetocola tolaasinivorans]|uniref:Uncharacterized protein n=1 Tax=Mycetocola tolaasinivorans TaxID=76635 RepID=A0A3L7A4D1_9MICO|nr:hypothetical protein D9V32_13960 [Mycetocola tolaasinivorans]
MTGDAGTALIRNVVVRSASESEGNTTKRALPWSAESSLSAADAAGYHKVVLFAKNVDGSRGALSCEITINGEVVASQHTTGYKPITCLYHAN